MFFLAEFHLSGKKWLLIYKYKKEKKSKKNPSESEEITIFFVKHT